MAKLDEEGYVPSDDHFKVKVVPVKRSKMDRFHAVDVLYKVYFETTEESKDIPMLACLFSIYAAIQRLLNQLRKFYRAYDLEKWHGEKRREEAEWAGQRLLYMACFIPSMTSPIFLGGRELSDKDNADALLTTIFSYLLSNTTINCKEGLEIHCTVVGLGHAQHLRSTSAGTKMMFGSDRPAQSDTFTLGRKKAMKRIPYMDLNEGRRTKSLFKIPNGMDDIGDGGSLSTLFKNQCLPVAFTCAFLLRKGFKNSSTSGGKTLLHKLNKLHSDCQTRQRASAAFIIEQTFRLALDPLGLGEGPHPVSTMDRLCDKYQCSATIFSRAQGGKVIYRYPAQFDPSRIPLYFFSIGGIEADHLHVIRNLGFFSQSRPCPVCLVPKTQMTRHKCKSQRNKSYICRYCYRIALTDESDYWDKNLANELCLAKVKRAKSGEGGDEKPIVTCICGKKFHDVECWRYHKMRCTVVECPRCKALVKMTSKGWVNQPLLQILQRLNHVCFESSCRLCHAKLLPKPKEEEEENDSGTYLVHAEEKFDFIDDHECHIRMPTFPKAVRRLAVLDAETYQNGQNEHQCNLVSVLFESGNHGKWWKISFADEGLTRVLGDKVDTLEEDVVVDQYLPSGYSDFIERRNTASPFYRKANWQTGGGMAGLGQYGRKRNKRSTLEKEEGGSAPPPPQTKEDYLKAYYATVRSFMPSDLKHHPFFKAFAFLYNKAHVSTTIIGKGEQGCNQESRSRGDDFLFRSQ